MQTTDVQTTDPNFRVAKGSLEVTALISSLFVKPGPRPERAYGISNLDMLERRFPGFVVDSANFARLAANIPSRFIYTSRKGPIITSNDDLFMRHSKYLPPEQLEGCEDMTIAGDTVVFMTDTGTDVEAQAITNQAIARQMVSIFSFLWAYAD